jgi:hypothetical protein
MTTTQGSKEMNGNFSGNFNAKMVVHAEEATTHKPVTTTQGSKEVNGKFDGNFKGKIAGNGNRSGNANGIQSITQLEFD